jgi:hypothetical protein
MRNRHTLLGPALAIAICLGATACGPLRLDETPHIRGTLVTVDGRIVGIKHKTGRTYQVEITPETTIVNRGEAGAVALCAGQRATVFLAGPQRFTAASITLWNRRCR